ncbi:NAD-dependent epimerase/dehydratase family protein [Flavobacterium branchiophilum]|uniref:NAD-dependent epimerase/dehydratase domain-containing protein n=1 Tax=Flavobacterium branchiophilum TaxID=55197 RepID=A0A2H3KA87_9FLAO|nr:NAD-dependent epimerase/dehydratase family protein [Flavobacterium branchiophilum]PDS23404.1 hypothetical protein B0A77_10905 [Flavobacterium branchiophilum]
MTRILITGRVGFVGSNLCLKLKKKNPNYHIIAFDNLKRIGSGLNLLDLNKINIGFIHGGIRNGGALEGIGVKVRS